MAGEASSSSSASAVATYVVFLNFRGVDTRNGFVSHLHACFRENRIEAFMDVDGLDQGQEISPYPPQEHRGVEDHDCGFLREVCAFR
ncbi:hypothetical protein MLD38_037809 [Melastoma candidum]|uniref:Uncharacterized protein n=1 Tax=Melastoma candidum TaxID=119954 RepID=A0ACB9LNF1_9MYRT|nr:hypothetical protein MLD38_037809 [Melastoma candidum]